jgi:MYXO-CTERM domain-containing protein
MAATPRTPRFLAALLALAGLATAAVALPAGAAETPECAAPNVLILLDVSGSMKSAANPAGKYAAAVPAITAVTAQFDQQIRFGLMLFPDPSQGYCGVTTDMAVTPDLGTGAAIASVLTSGAAGFFGGPLATFDTPMKQALDAVAGVSALRDEARRSYVLLLTDGMQDCCRKGDYDDEPDCDAGTTNLNGTEVRDNRADLVSSVEGLLNQGNPVYVVGFGSAVDALTLNAMAEAAGTDLLDCDPLEANPALGLNCYYRVDESTVPGEATAALQAALASVVRLVGIEVCDGIDNDCDGAVDEGYGVGAACDGTDEDRCADGVVKCDLKGGARCVETGAPDRTERCDGLDNDCDGATDEGFAVGLACDGDDADQCAEGTWTCGPSGMGVVCDEAGPGHVETCNGVDDDCNGVVDDDTAVQCESACGVSLRRCVDGVLGECGAAVPLDEDVCGNGRDDDCDGTTDEDWARTCVTACGEGLESCTDGQWTPCTAPAVVAEACNGVDDDCNGVTDDGDLCGEGAQCFCGGCQAPCGVDGSCPGGLACAEGLCVDDHCPAGQHCEGRLCLAIPPVQPGYKAGGGCGCRTGAGPVPSDGAPWVAAALAAAWLAVRRRKAVQDR